MTSLSFQMMEMLMGSLSTPVTWDPARIGPNIILSGGNLIATAGSNTFESFLATLGRSSGKYYFELAPALPFGSGGGQDQVMGLALVGQTLTSYVGSTTDGYGYYQRSGQTLSTSGAPAYGPSWKNGEVPQCAIDFATMSIWFGVDNVWKDGGDPSTGATAAFTGITAGTYFPAGSHTDTNIHQRGRFKASDFTYSPPAGFLPWE